MKKLITLTFIGFLLFSCNDQKAPAHQNESLQEEKDEKLSVLIQSDKTKDFDVMIPITGRYKITFFGRSAQKDAKVWIEDYRNNKDDRSYNITGSISLNQKGIGSVDGSPLESKTHPMKIHIEDSVYIDSLSFELIKKHEPTAKNYTQNMDGDEWQLIWSDEFDGKGLPDSSKWNYNVGNWGWGNNEPQYYTEKRTQNARQENGNLIIEAHKNDLGYDWTSARLTTQGKASFTYGRIEFRAKVPPGRGTWAAGWLLGDEYKDELSWPYCGEIDVLECVGFEINDTTGKGLNHATCHTRAYYFKQGNQIGSEIEVDSMNTKFHTYAIEWYPDVIKAYLDGEHYYTYDKNQNELEWPFDKPQNIIINLAVGGGWGGAKGIDDSYDSHQYILDYVRVYGKK